MNFKYERAGIGGDLGGNGQGVFDILLCKYGHAGCNPSDQRQGD